MSMLVGCSSQPKNSPFFLRNPLIFLSLKKEGGGSPAGLVVPAEREGRDDS